MRGTGYAGHPVNANTIDALQERSGKVKDKHRPTKDKGRNKRTVGEGLRQYCAGHLVNASTVDTYRMRSHKFMGIEVM